MGVVESAADGFVGLDDAETRLSPRTLARRERLIGRVVVAAVVLVQVAWCVGLLAAAWVFVFS